MRKITPFALFFFSFSLVPETYQKKDFPKHLYFHHRNNKAYLWEKSLIYKDTFTIYYFGYEKLEMRFPEPYSLQNQLFSLEGSCEILEGNFRLYLSLKIKQKKYLVPLQPFLLKKSDGFQQIVINKSDIIKYLKKYTDLHTLQYEVTGITLHPYHKRTILICHEFHITVEKALEKSL